MINETPPLLVIATLPQSFSLSTLEQSAKFTKIAKINNESFRGLDQCEILVDGMSFIANIYSDNDTLNIVRENCENTIFGVPIASGSSSIGISMGEHIRSGKHIPIINKAFLKLAVALGEEITATHVAWLPAQQSIGFDHFSESVKDYLNEGPTPILIQIAIAKNDDGKFQTRGLNYFAGQEIALDAPTDMSDGDAIKRLVRISHDIAINGKIDNKLDADGLEKGETISYRPSPNLSQLHIKIASA